MPHLPAFMITGPRACGKTTTAAEWATSVLRLDEPGVAALFRDELDRYLAGLEAPVLIDEWQFVPEGLGAVKRLVDQDGVPGRFLITGSVRARMMEGTWPGTGRFTPVTMYGMTQAERRENLEAAAFLDRLFEGDLHPQRIEDAPSVLEYLELAAEGGFPEVIRFPASLRSRWNQGYATELITRDVVELAEIKQPQQMMDVLKASALNTAGLPHISTLMEAAGASRYVMEKYLNLLEELFIIERLPAWQTNKLTRMVKTPKLHVLDTGLGMWLAEASPEVLERDTRLRGAFLDSFVLAQLRPLVALNERSITCSHLRDTNGDREIDLILESRGGDLVGIEIKASRRVSRKDAAHLEWFRDRMGDRFKTGVVFHTGDYAGEISDRIWLMPISTIWA